MWSPGGNVELGLSLGAATSASASQARTISGVVSAEATGLGIAETAVVVSQASGGGTVATTITALDGSYSVEVPEGTYDITFTPPSGSGFESVVDQGESVTGNETIDVGLVSGGQERAKRVTWSGVLRGEGGVPLPYGELVLRGSGEVGLVYVAVGSDGAFSVSVPVGVYRLSVFASYTQLGGGFTPGYWGVYFRGAVVDLSEDLHQDLTLPVHMVTVHVLRADGAPETGEVGVGITGRETEEGGEEDALVSGAGLLAPGIEATEGHGGGATSANGSVTVAVPDFPAGAATGHVSIPYGQGEPSFDASGVSEDESISVKLPEESRFAGVVRGESGAPLAGVRVRLRATDGAGEESATTESNGSFTIRMLDSSMPPPYKLSIEGPGWKFAGAPVPLGREAGLTQELTVPLHTLTVSVLGSGGAPLSDVGLKPLAGSEGLVTLARGGGALAPGIEASEAELHGLPTTTGTNGSATLSLPDLAGEPQIQVTPPADIPSLLPTNFSIAGITQDQTQIISFQNYSTATSAGRAKGTVTVTSPSGTQVTGLTAEHVEEDGGGLPNGAVALVGKLSYEVTQVPVGGTIKVNIELPPGSEPTQIYKLVNGRYVNLTSAATITGNIVTLSLTDGGLGDEDGVANGRVDDPLIPASTTEPPNFGRCLKATARGAGRFGSANCTTSGGTKAYEWYPAFESPSPLLKRRFTTKSSTSATVKLETKAKQLVICKTETGEGEYSGLRGLSDVTLHLAGCSYGSAEKCTSPGEVAGEVVSKSLTGTLGVILASRESPSKDKIGLALRPQAGTAIAEFACGTAQMMLSGSVIAEVKRDTMALANGVWGFTQAKGAQKPARFEGGPEEALKLKIGAAVPEPVGVTLKATEVNEEAVEINAVI
jgi:hypothetical protein